MPVIDVDTGNYVFSDNVIYPTNKKLPIKDADIFWHPATSSVEDNDPIITIVKCERVNNMMYVDKLFKVNHNVKPHDILIVNGHQKSFDIVTIGGKKYIKFLDQNINGGTVMVLDMKAEYVKTYRSLTNAVKEVIIEIDMSQYAPSNRNAHNFFAFSDSTLMRPTSLEITGMNCRMTFNYISEIQIYAAIPDMIMVTDNLPSGKLMKSDGYIPYDVIRISENSLISKLPNPDMKYYPYFEFESDNGLSAIYLFKKVLVAPLSESILKSPNWFNPIRKQDLLDDPFTQSRFIEMSLDSFKGTLIDWLNPDDVNYIKFKNHLKKFKDNLIIGSRYSRCHTPNVISKATSVLTEVQVLFTGSVMNRKMYMYNENLVLLYQDIKAGAFFHLSHLDVLELHGNFNSETGQFIQNDSDPNSIKLISIRSTSPSRDIEKVIVINDIGNLTASNVIPYTDYYMNFYKMPNGDIGISEKTVVTDTPNKLILSNASDLGTIHRTVMSRQFNYFHSFGIDNGFFQIYHILKNMFPNRLHVFINGVIIDDADVSKVIAMRYMENIIYNRKDIDDEILIMITPCKSRIFVDPASLNQILLTRGILELPQFNPSSDILLLNGRLIPYEQIQFIFGKVWFVVEGFHRKVSSKYNGYGITKIEVIQCQNNYNRMMYNAMYESDFEYYNHQPEVTKGAVYNQYPILAPTKFFVPSAVGEYPDLLHGPADYMVRLFQKTNPIEVLMEIGDDPARLENFKETFKKEFAMMNVKSLMGLINPRGDKIIINANSNHGKYDPT